MKIKISKKLAYWVGIVQSDGYLDEYFDKNRKLKFFRISLCVSKKSLPMLKRFQEISMSVLCRETKIFNCKNNIFKSTIGVKELLKEFKKLDIKFGDPPRPPKWVVKNADFFGSYLAGIIDGDGNVSTRRNKCEIRIASKYKQRELKEIAEKFLNCKTRIDSKVKVSGCYYFCFLVSSKNYKFVKKYLLPNLAIDYKKELIKEYIMERFGI